MARPIYDYWARKADTPWRRHLFLHVIPGTSLGEDPASCGVLLWGPSAVGLLFLEGMKGSKRGGGIINELQNVVCYRLCLVMLSEEGEEDHYSASSRPPSSPNTLHTTNFLFFSTGYRPSIYISIPIPHRPAHRAATVVRRQRVGGEGRRSRETQLSLQRRKPASASPCKS
ncbi:hypothetical protein FJTKL_02561 [Diaporthe vaccinii]|uniref:Uncharacterized protein n=1 Tax=Diaporthe vaccinii TaxID=105482 RepID=A0ABR4DXW5_9PEZI